MLVRLFVIHLGGRPPPLPLPSGEISATIPERASERRTRGETATTDGKIASEWTLIYDLGYGGIPKSTKNRELELIAVMLKGMIGRRS